MVALTSSDSDLRPAPHVGFIVEQTLGHRTHSSNIESILEQQRRVVPEWLPIAWDATGIAAALPVFNSNWTVRSGLRARRAVARADGSRLLDALFVHTQVPAVLLGKWLDRIPTVVSLDATPRQYDELGSFYQHRVGGPEVERLKWVANRRALRRAWAIVTWSEWARSGVIEDYGIEPDKVLVVPPGVRVEEWRRLPSAAGPRTEVRILFVGGDLERKGGDLLVASCRTLRAELARSGGPEIDLVVDLVTQTPIDPDPGVVVHHGLTANSPELRALYHHADIFCLPTLGDCLPMVLAEAGAAGLPLVSTDVGAISEIVRDGDTGLLVPPSDQAALTVALRRLVHDGGERVRMGANAAELVAREHDATTNVGRIIDLLVDAATSRPPISRRRRAPLTGGTAAVVTVSGVIPPDLEERIASGQRPRADFVEMAAAMGGARIIDRSLLRSRTGPVGRLVVRFTGPDVAMAWACFRQRRTTRVIVTDGEQIGLPFAALCWLPGRRRPRHVMIVHVMSTPTKSRLFRMLRLERHVDCFVTYATSQTEYLVDRLRVPPHKVSQTPFMVDTDFFHPAASTEPRADLVCAVGLERRDYATLIDAVRGLDVEVVIAADSPWSTRPDTTNGLDLPANVEVRSFDPVGLRDLYARCRFLVMPLDEVDFQAGVTALLEAMAMERAVICSRTTGQTDVVAEAVTGIYVPVGDAPTLRREVLALLADPERADRMGRAGRRYVVDQCDISMYSRSIAAIAQHSPSTP
ncbi:MAG: glycosyltransferase family 4 protein [Acidimicrobiia bacterium]|nr:glycosyltransferase family 4 protein [Acidimicrobiia bacterium]